MSLSLILTLFALALVDSINTSTIWLVVIILLTTKKPLQTGWTYVAGAVIPFYIFAVALFAGLAAADSMLDEATGWIRTLVFIAIAGFFIYLGIGRLKTRPRHELEAPRWVNAATVFPIGMLASLADLPNAFPLLLAIERLVEHSIALSTGTIVLAIYTFIYALPTIIVLIAGLIYRERVLLWIKKKLRRFTTGEAKASWKLATVYFLAAGLSLALAFILH